MNADKASISNIYARSLYTACEGYPLWNPSKCELGDIGFIRQGTFHTIYNAAEGSGAVPPESTYDPENTKVDLFHTVKKVFLLSLSQDKALYRNFTGTGKIEETLPLLHLAVEPVCAFDIGPRMSSYYESIGASIGANVYADSRYSSSEVNQIIILYRITIKTRFGLTKLRATARPSEDNSRIPPDKEAKAINETIFITSDTRNLNSNETADPLDMVHEYIWSRVELKVERDTSIASDDDALLLCKHVVEERWLDIPEAGKTLQTFKRCLWDAADEITRINQSNFPPPPGGTPDWARSWAPAWGKTYCLEFV
ncbi:uncharacterized protein FA14DRAFT_186039 [Meira miltonrushii]|uniref:Uncharacterized protein n=1 Tax=Meira miltonrushii TaxID=1280837 RepID=A0A316V490_9BASI|nr:uncharacterized protein FA14DRAFT_186039 [Meira miltonrushii]PWN32272.1 hypothetical protein FA14DRAFT_186039 [Meira miltonrushii]